MSAIIYTRFSPRRNADKSESCETQEELCRAYASGHGLTVRKVCADKDLSGSDANRPGLIEAIASLRRGDVLLVYHRDRIARDVLIAELTRRQVAAAGATILAVSGDVAGNDADPTVTFTRQIMDSVAELGRKQIAIKTSDAMLQLQRQGRRMGRWTPYGWKIDPADPKRMIQHAAEQVVVQRIRDLAEAGHPAGRIRRILDEELPGSARGSRWTRNTIVKILKRAEA